MSDLIDTVYGAIARIWRPRRFALFVSTIEPRCDDVILDVGGLPGSWTGLDFAVARIDKLNLYPIDERLPENSAPIRTLVGDACALPFPDRSYDIVFSNSVIEHVGDADRQRQFAREVNRVGRRLWIQTPAYEFPVEPHCLAPFIHWLPWDLRKVLLRFTPLGLLWKGDREQFVQMMHDTRLLTKKEFTALFPDCTIYTERLFGLIPKSYVAYRRRDA